MPRLSDFQGWKDVAHDPNNKTGKVILNETYDITDEIKIKDRTISFAGSGMSFGGGGIRWTGDLYKDAKENGKIVKLGTASKAMLKYAGAPSATLDNMMFKGKRSVDPLLFLKACIWLITENDEKKTTQQRHTYSNINIGDPLGASGDRSGGYEFMFGILCGDGLNHNNDFHTFNNINVATARVAFAAMLSMAVDWTYNNCCAQYVDVMFQYTQGGSFTANTPYAMSHIKEGILYANQGNGYQLRAQMNNFNSEHLECKYFLKADGMVRLTVSAGILDIGFVPGEENLTTEDATPFQLIGGEMMRENSVIKFVQFTFQTRQRRIYIDCTGSGMFRTTVIFEHCTHYEHIYLRVPMTHQGFFVPPRIMVNYSEVELRSDYDKLSGEGKIITDNKNQCYWLKLKDLIK